MLLEDYIEEWGIRISALARKCGVTSQTIYNILDGRDVKISIAIKLEDATKGHVTPRDLLATLKNKSKKKKNTDAAKTAQ